MISCGARLPIYSLIIPAFFPQMWQGTILFSLYFIGIIMVLIGAKLLRLTVFKGESEALLMELPAYRMPTLRNILLHSWQRGKRYLQKAGTIILAAAIIMWFLSTYPPAPANLQNSQNPAIEYSFAGKIGKALEPLMKPLGFDWKICTSLIGAIPGKEMFVAQLAILHSIDTEQKEGEQALRDTLQKEYTPLTALSILFFTMISMPCLATLAIVRLESGKWRWALFQAAGLTILAYIVSFIIFQTGKLLGFN
jgi:ferrous iron transport protein B